MISKKEIKIWFYIILVSLALSLLMRIFFKYSFLSSSRAVFGLIYVLFLPGYIVVRCFFNKLGSIEKAGLSIVLSIVLVILSVILTNMLLKIHITSLTNFFVILAVTITTLLIYKGTKH